MSNRGTGREAVASRKRIFALGLLAAALLAFLYMGFSHANTPDRDEIITALDDVRAGVEKQSTGQVMSHVSNHFQGQSMTRQQATATLLQFFNLYRGATGVLFRNPQISVNGENATATVDTEVTGAPGSGGGAPSSVYHGSVTLEFTREPARRLIFFPDHVWKITKLSAPNAPQMEGL